MPSEMEQSYELIGRIFEKLIQSGLRAVDLDALQLMPGKHELSDDENDLFLDVMHFLKAENLIRTKATSIPISGEGMYFGVQLTSLALNAIEDGRFGKGETVRKTIEKGHADDKGLSSESYGKIGSFVGGLMGSMAQALGG